MPEQACSGNPWHPAWTNAVAWRRATTWSSDKQGRIATLPGPWVKAKYDPENVFHNNKNIQPASPVR
jgi:hypothetical protein